MIQFQGLYGVPLAAPASLQLAAEIGLRPIDRTDAATIDPAAVTRRLSRTNLRVLHAAANLARAVTANTIAAAMTRDVPPAAQLSARLSALRDQGYLRRIAGQSRASFWQVTPTGIACAAHDRATLSDSAILQAVAAINLCPLGGRQHWWPGDMNTEPATASTVGLMLFSSERPGVAIGQRLAELAMRGDLQVHRWPRGPGVVTLLYRVAAKP